MQVVAHKQDVGRNVCACVCAKNLQIDKSFRGLRTLCLLLQLTFFATLMYCTRRLRSVRLGYTWGVPIYIIVLYYYYLHTYPEFLNFQFTPEHRGQVPLPAGR